MNIKQAVYLNKIAQGHLPLNESVEWFNELAIEQRADVLEMLIYFILQSGVSASSISNCLESSISFSNLKVSHTPVQILKSIERSGVAGSAPLRIGLYKFLKLPEAEQGQAFSLMLGILNYIFGIKKNSDPRKWWYQDLSQAKNLPQG